MQSFRPSGILYRPRPSFTFTGPRRQLRRLHETFSRPSVGAALVRIVAPKLEVERPFKKEPGNLGRVRHGRRSSKVPTALGSFWTSPSAVTCA
jgi:hypothetical protein